MKKIPWYGKRVYEKHENIHARLHVLGDKCLKMKHRDQRNPTTFETFFTGNRRHIKYYSFIIFKMHATLQRTSPPSSKMSICFVIKAQK